MTNNDKLKEIKDFITDAAIAASRNNPNKNYSSAEWIYNKGYAAAMKHTRSVILDIIEK